MGLLSDVMSACRYVTLTWLAVCVQTFMLLQVAFFYALLCRQSRRNAGTKTASVTDGAAGTVGIATGELDFVRCVISIIVMARNEEKNIAALLQRIGTAASQPERLEVVVVDSGCSDGTLSVAQREEKTLPFRLSYTKASGGRGPSLDAGTAAAKGEIIFALHADCVVCDGFDDLIRAGLARPGVLATAFRFTLNREQLTEPLPGAEVMEFTVGIRARLLQLPFGDQGLALTARRLRGYSGWGGAAYPLLEDFQLVQKMRVDGALGRGRIEILTAPLYCSPRRWTKLGVWRVNLVNQLVMIWYRFGGTAQELFDFYYGIDSDRAPRWLMVLTAPLLRGH